ncbi:aminotransferase [Anaerosporomusa subterranea]|uniref:Aminotransferase n=1 Tax=Anaerosporomusa subterranea TaxID=1794912 RepID=A0A154BPB4_ANASB|nr:aminotransferase class I/II-fold pyridoxal phosphate-dependent enzyme [Anaerosporomusa subterranea]KYZ75690.1 aminotransferase [Anaerosporomusa subterranea]
MSSRLASHAQGKVFVDEVFDAVAAVGRATTQFGKANVLNATIGSLCDEQEKLVLLPTVENVFRNLNSDDIAGYASVRGFPEYLSAAIEQTFKNSKPDAYIEAVATSGGTGAIHNFIWNFSNLGDAVLTHDWHWQPYSVLCSDIMRRLETFAFFDENQKFNIKSFESKVRELIAKQDNLVIILNTPNHNPTGYSLTDAEWDQVIAVVNQNATGKKTIAIMADIAYIDYAADPNQCRTFMKKFDTLAPNVFGAFAFSMSKGFTLYGQRMGALIGVSKDKQAIDEFVNASVITCRTRWSNLSRAAMRTLAEIYKDKALLAQVDQERRQYAAILQQRADLFVAEAKTAGLNFLPYTAGFFITIPTDDPVAASNILRQSNIFVVPMAKGLRIAVCAVPVNKIRGLAAKVAESVK